MTGLDFQISLVASLVWRLLKMIAAQTTIPDWIHLIRSEYLEIPSLHDVQDKIEAAFSAAPRLTRGESP